MRTLLESVPILSRLARKALDLLSSEGSDYALANGEIIFHEAEPDDSIFVIESGHVRIFRLKRKSDVK